MIINAATYREQAFKILDPERTETVCNGDWFRAMSFEDVIRLNSRVTLQQLLQREDFKARIEESTLSAPMKFNIQSCRDGIR